MSKIENGGLDKYGAEPVKRQQFGTAGVEGVNNTCLMHRHLLCINCIILGPFGSPALFSTTSATIISGRVIFRLNFRLKGYVSRQYLRYHYLIIKIMNILDRQIAEWSYYNLVTGSCHTKKLCNRRHSIAVDFYLKKRKNRFLSHPLEDLGVTYAIHP